MGLVGESTAGPGMVGGRRGGTGAGGCGTGAWRSVQPDDRGAACVRGRTVARGGPEGALLNRVDQLVGENVAAAGGAQGEFAGAEHNVRSVRQGARVVKLCEGLSGRAGVKTEAGKVEAEDWLEAVAQGGRKRGAGAETGSRGGRGDNATSRGWAGGFLGRRRRGAAGEPAHEKLGDLFGLAFGGGVLVDRGGGHDRGRSVAGAFRAMSPASARSGARADALDGGSGGPFLRRDGLAGPLSRRVGFGGGGCFGGLSHLVRILPGSFFRAAAGACAPAGAAGRMGSGLLSGGWGSGGVVWRFAVAGHGRAGGGEEGAGKGGHVDQLPPPLRHGLGTSIRCPLWV